MEEIDKEPGKDEILNEDEDMFLREVIRDDHQLLYLDTYLREVLSKKPTSEV